MEQTAGLCIRNFDSSEIILSEIKNFFSTLEDKPVDFDKWCNGLMFYKERGEIRVLSDVQADYYDYDIILCDLIEHLAKNLPTTVLSGSYDLNVEYEDPEFHYFELKGNGQVIWDNKNTQTTEDIDDDALLTAVDNADETTLFRNIFTSLSCDDIKKVFDTCALIYGDGSIESAYEEYNIEDTPTLDDLISIASECQDIMCIPTIDSYISFLVDTLAKLGITIELPNELKSSLNK